jgi:hypothetical protein
METVSQIKMSFHIKMELFKMIPWYLINLVEVERRSNDRFPRISRWYAIQHLLTIPGAIVAVVVWYLDLQLPMQSVPITTDVVNKEFQKYEASHKPEFGRLHGNCEVFVCLMVFNATFNNISAISWRAIRAYHH